MASTRPTVQVYGQDGKAAGGSVVLPAVFSAPVRLDVLQQVYKSVSKNKRQPYAVAREAGHQTSAESWGTGRAVARIPRVSGGGTSASGRAAFGNMVKGGRMFAPTRVWRKWHVKVNQNQRRFATVSALAATAIPSLVLARGHRIEGVEEVPLVLSDSVQSVVKTKEAVAALKAVNAHADVTKVINSTKSRAGRGKTRGRRFQARRGPLVIYAEDNGLVKAFRNIPGVEVANVTRLNMLQLAPGGHLGRFCIWTESAFKALDSVYGTNETASEFKKGYTLPAAKIANPDIQRIINSTEVQSVLRAAGPRKVKRPFVQKKNPLKNQGVMFRLNPYAKAYKRRELLNLEKKRSGAPKAEKDGKKLSAGKEFLDTLSAP